MESKMMKALVYRGPNQYGLEDVPVPKISDPQDAIVKVTLSTICTSDNHIVNGEVAIAVPPKIVGHEFNGEIVELGSAVEGFKIGDKVHVNAAVTCGECYYCKIGMAILCEKGGCYGANGPDGCQAEYVRIPFAKRTMIPIPEGLKDEDVLLLSDMLGTGWFGVKSAEVGPQDTVAIIGCGPVGLSACMLAKKVFGAKKVIAMDLLQYRVDTALKEGIADYGINPATDDVEQKIMEITGGLGCSAVVECVGSSDAFNLSLAVVGLGGRVSTVGVFAEPVEVPMQELCYKNIKVSGGMQHLEGVPEMLELIAKGTIDTKFMQTHRAPLNDIMKGYDVFGNKKDGCIKWLVTPYER